MKRSEWLQLVDLAVDFRSKGDGAGYYGEQDEAERAWARYGAFDDAAEELMDKLSDMPVDVEDVELCPANEVAVGSFGRRKHPHAQGSRPLQDVFGGAYGCAVCTEYTETTKA